jgi:hypothetical protein
MRCISNQFFRCAKDRRFKTAFPANMLNESTLHGVCNVFLAATANELIPEKKSRVSDPWGKF